ncbi:MAG: hypothetical protein H7252_08400 [Cytophaga sp.]|nr:hypothetical protein [Undibacterium sp.]
MTLLVRQLQLKNVAGRMSKSAVLVPFFHDEAAINKLTDVMLALRRKITRFKYWATEPVGGGIILAQTRFGGG